MTFRWYGEGDSIRLDYIAQIHGISGVVTAIYDVPVGEVWSEEKIFQSKRACEKNGLEMEVVESVPVHEDIKLGKDTRDRYIENYKQNIRNLSKYGVKCICYNFMPVFDWLRTDLYHKNWDGSTSLKYDHVKLMGLDRTKLSLPGWDESYASDELNGLLGEYDLISEEKSFENLVYFLEKIIPVCEECDINMAIHPDDPPWGMFGLPRIITDESHLDNLFDAVKSKRNGLTFCTGSLGASRDNDLVKMAEKYAKRIHFAHVRQIAWENEKDFVENGHQTISGSLDTYAIVKALVKNGFDGYVRPDHGRNIWGESGKPGYGLYDRALGAAYLSGLFEAIKKDLNYEITI